MTKQRTIEVPSLAEKLAWSVDMLIPQRAQPQNEGEHATPAKGAEIKSVSALYGRLSEGRGERWLPTRANWLKDVARGRASLETLEMIREVFPELTVALLREPDLGRFRDAMSHLVAARDRYVSLGRYFLAERDRLAAFSKAHYANADEIPDWPLLAKAAWRPRQPVPIGEDSRIDRFEPTASYPAGSNLAGLNARYGQIRRLLSPESKPPFNGECYRLLGIDFSADTIFNYGPCRYFDYYDTCEIHALKIASLHRDGTAPLALDPFDIGTRAAVPGVNALTVLRNFRVPGEKDCDRFLLHRRSRATVQAGNTLHVVPAGQHQPSQAFYGLDADVSIWRTMVREFCEELYSVPEAHGLSVAAGDPLESPAFRRIVNPVFRSDASRAWLLGAGLDPVTAKPEILVVNVVDFSKIPIQQRDQLQRHSMNWEGKRQIHELTRTQVETQLSLDRSNDLKWLPAGKACLQEFLRHMPALLT